MAYKYRYKKSPKIDYKTALVLIFLVVLGALLYNLKIREVEEEVPTPTCSVDSDCMWCGFSCVKKQEGINCPAVMPNQGYVCVCEQENCIEKYIERPPNCETGMWNWETKTWECPSYPPTALKGELVIVAKDVMYKLTGGYTVTGLNLTIKSIQIHKTETNDTDENITAEGWITVFNGTKTLDLVEYSEDVIALLGEKELEPGKYTQIRLYIAEVDVKLYNTIVYVWNKTYEAKVPSKVLKLIHPFTIEENKTLVLTLDFDVVKSFCEDIVCRRDGQWIFRPTLKTNVGPLNDGILEETLEKGQRPESSVKIPEEK